MNADIAPALDALMRGVDVTNADVRRAFGPIMRGEAGDAETAALLTALAIRGESAVVLAGAAAELRDHATRIRPQAAGLLDTCGTGGDRLHTFNISTASALAAAACGVPVAKHGNRSVSSSSGSADVLEALGVNLDVPAATVAACVDEVGIGFLYAKQLHPAMRHVAGVRQQLGFRTVFNLLGPLINPADASFHLLGTGRIETARVLADAVAQLGVPKGGRTVVVCGNNQIDEVALWGTTSWFSVSGDGGRDAGTWTPGDFGLDTVEVADLRVTNAAESAAVIRKVLAGEPGPASDMVAANTAAALWCCGRAESVAEGVATVRSTLGGNSGLAVLDRLVANTREA